jgi:GR25 family glycosyltransferase involved in LPS biosynthesis
MDLVEVYCINFMDEERRSKMIARFESQHISVHFVDPVHTSDPRIDPILNKRVTSIMLQHMDSIRHFYEQTSNAYAIICEDDILLSNTFAEDLPNILEIYNELKIDVLLLGYLLPFQLTKDNHHHEFKLLKESNNYAFYDFPYHLWGSQMYLIHREHAKFLLDKYTIEYATADIARPYNPDWTLTKDKNKALVYPMLALEEGCEKSNDPGQSNYHLSCFLANYTCNYS